MSPPPSYMSHLSLHDALPICFGPRFLHSTGQAYKGGLNTGVFLQITCDDAADLAVPGHAYTFGVVKDRKSTRLNSSHQIISYAVFCLKKKKVAPCVPTHALPF